MHRKHSIECAIIQTTCKNWRSWCRLCGKQDGQHVDIFRGRAGEPQLVGDLNITSIIKEFFNIQIKEDTELPRWLCSECCNTLTSLSSYAEHIKRVQKMYESLCDIITYAEMELTDVYHKFGLVQCEIFRPQLLPGRKTEAITASTSGIEQIFVLPMSEVKDEEMEEFCEVTKIQPTIIEKQDEIKTELPDPFGSDSNIVNARGCAQKSEEDGSGSEYSGNESESSSSSNENNKHRQTATNPIDNEDTATIALPRSGENGEDEDFTCSICQKQFIQKRNYNWHMKNKHELEVPQYKCEHCSCTCTFRRKKDLDRHVKKVHEPTVYPCPHCARQFKLKKVFENHIKKEHEGEGCLVCEECGETVRTKERLIEHMGLHSGGAFECEQCGKRFARKTYLKKHLEIHGDKHICGECGAELTTSKALKYHMKVHSDEMPYKCNYCGRRFKRTKNLKNHLITHTGLKPYSCDFCDKTFSTGSSCRYHKKHLHPQELAAMEASGVKSYTKNIPKMAVLKAITTQAVTGDVEKIAEAATTDKRIRLPKLDSELPDA